VLIATGSILPIAKLKSKFKELFLPKNLRIEIVEVDHNAYSYKIPTWMKNENGMQQQKRVWADIVEMLEIKGHPIKNGTE
jgi:hypothetical protein